MKIIERLEKNPALSHLPVAGILLDLALICWAALLSLTTPWIVSHLRLFHLPLDLIDGCCIQFHNPGD